MAHIVLVDDDRDYIDTLATVINRQGHRTEIHSDTQSALNAMERDGARTWRLSLHRKTCRFRHFPREDLSRAGARIQPVEHRLLLKRGRFMANPGMKKLLSWFAAVGGGIVSVLGILGAGCVICAPVCGAVCIAGPLALLGGGAAIFLHRYSLLFSIGGGLLFAGGMVLFVRSFRRSCRPKSACSTVKDR